MKLGKEQTAIFWVCDSDKNTEENPLKQTNKNPKFKLMEKGH